MGWVDGSEEGLAEPWATRIVASTNIHAHTRTRRYTRPHMHTRAHLIGDSNTNSPAVARASRVSRSDLLWRERGQMGKVAFSSLLSFCILGFRVHLPSSPVHPSSHTHTHTSFYDINVSLCLTFVCLRLVCRLVFQRTLTVSFVFVLRFSLFIRGYSYDLLGFTCISPTGSSWVIFVS